ncbi:MAG: WsbC [Oscillospiraceae bacterium]|jgi:glycosyltransferase involved in cell wall biosynthesis|nr:WsbC [Oscillospiraceae bacterium]
MNEYTAADNPPITILMAIYEPRIDWLREQLESLNAQTYPNLKLLIRDDCSPTVPYDEIHLCVQNCITAFPYEIHRNEKNLGHRETFERLTKEADGALFAYCDQDDIWLPQKLSTLAAAIKAQDALLACSDMYIIDDNGKQTAESISQVRRHHVFYNGDRLAEKLLFHNFVTGCTMLVYAEVAKAATPFCPYMIHDHYLALWCANHGKILSVLQPLIRYRIHSGNQTGMMAGVVDKESYGKIRIELGLKKMCWLQEHFEAGSELQRIINEGTLWMQARITSWNRKGGWATVCRYCHFSPLTSIAELILVHFSDRLFMKAISLAKKNYV